MRPTLYQVFHPWHWITYGQNSSAVGAMAAVIAAIAAAIAGIYAIRTYRATLTQLNLARDQAKLATAQMQSALRPLLVLRQELSPHFSSFYIENAGSGSAHRVSWDYAPPGDHPYDWLFDPNQDLERLLTTNLLHSASQEPIELDSKRFKETGFLLKYFSFDGRIFITRIGRRGDGTVIHYQIDLAEPTTAV